MSKRDQSEAEELWNSVSHGIGFLAALIAVPFLLLATGKTGTWLNVVGASVFASTMVLMYLTSAIYHVLPHGPRKKLFNKLDHSAIYLLIAGTYTPFTVGVLSGTWGWSLLGLIWALAAIGLVLKTFDRLSHPVLSTGLYLVMGWLIVLAATPMVARMPLQGLLLLLAGGLAYSGGVVFYVLDTRLRYSHFIWHLFVMTGTTFHFFAVMYYSA